MKHTYVKPEVLLMQLELQSIIALSTTQEEANPENPVLSRGNRRRRNKWDDEEEEDEEAW